MTTLWDAMPSENELELWWMTQAMHIRPERVAREAGVAVQLVAETVAGWRPGCRRRRGRSRILPCDGGRAGKGGASPGRPWFPGSTSWTRWRPWAVWQLLDPVCERPNVRVVARDGRETGLSLSLKKARPCRAAFTTVVRLGRMRREWVAAGGREPSGRAASGRASVRRESPPRAA